MTIAPLLGQLRDSANADVDRRLDSAREEARHLQGAASERLERRRSMELADRATRRASDRDRQLDAAHNVAAREILAASERLVARVLRSVLERAVDHAGTAATAAWFTATVQAALDYLPDGPVTLQTAHPAAPPPLIPGRAMRMEPGQSTLGVVLLSVDGGVRVEATLERFLRAERPRLAQAIIARAVTGSP